jgi:signal transduction histidine kinase
MPATTADAGAVAQDPQTGRSGLLCDVAKRACTLLAARRSVIELEHDGALIVAAGAGDLPPGLIGTRLAMRDALAGVAMRTRATQTLDSTVNLVRFRRYGAGRFGVDAECGLVVPLISGGLEHGALLVLDREGPSRDFTGEDRLLLEAFCIGAAYSVALAESARHDRLAAIEDERHRWARELHDETLQNLATLRWELARARGDASQATLGEAVDGAIVQLRREIENLRGLITQLRPAALEQMPLGAAIDELAERAARNGTEVEASIDLERERPWDEAGPQPDLDTAIYRIVQEALTNACKHARASRVAVDIRREQDTVLLTVQDDGRGFDPAAIRGGFGLIGMRENAGLLGGTLRIESSRSAGTTVLATVPIIFERPREEIELALS